jgi:uncharacterized protein (TIGR02271 family)
MFDTRADAEAAKNRLHAADVDATHVHVHDQSSAGTAGTGAYSTHEDRGIWDSVKNAFLPDEDRHTYEEGVRRGGAVLTADVEEHQVDEAVRVLEESNSIDIDERAGDWRSQGWKYGAGAGAVGAASLGTTDTARESFIGRDADDVVEEQAIPVVEEKLKVGKREVDRGGVRVRSYVTETPVHEQLRLRNERVDVERLAVDQPLSATDGDPFRERTVEMTARGEEAVVAKEARVVEEVIVRKTADEEVRDIDDTVRRTDVEVDKDVKSRTDTDRGPFTDRTKPTGY